MNGVRLPVWAKSVLREARRQRVSRVVASARSDARALRTLLRVSDSDVADRTAIAVRALNGRRVELRAGTTDAEVAVATFAGGYHLPPRTLTAIRSIWDIGANIGLTTAHFAELHPDAVVVAVEPHPANFELAQANTQSYADRCVLLQCAAWTSDGRVGLEGEAGPEDGYHVSATPSANPVDAVSLNTLLDRYGEPDYVKLDVEGAERELLREATEWSSSVRCISVECHPPYSLTACVADLGLLGFEAIAFPQTLRRRARDCVVGLRTRDQAA